MTGRNRKPRALKLVEGSQRADRDRPGEPTPPLIRPAAPSHRLSETGTAAWPEVVALVSELRVLSVADLVSLACMAEALGDLRAARASLAQPLAVGGVEVAAGGERFYWTGASGAPLRRPRPELAAINDADKRFAAWASKFGLTPSDRTKVTALPEDASNPFGAF